MPQEQLNLSRGRNDEISAESGELVTVGCAQTFLGMGGPRAAGHREKFGGKHAATMLAIAALLWQPISQAGMYTVKGGDVTRQSFSELKVTQPQKQRNPAPTLTDHATSLLRW